MNATVYLHSSERMPEVEDKSVRLLLGASVFLGKDVGWSEYAKLYQKVYIEEGLRVIRPDGVFVVIQTNAYQKGEFVCRYALLLPQLLEAGWNLIDERVWKRRNADFYQVPFSHVLVFTPPQDTNARNTIRRAQLNQHTGWFQGVWLHKQTEGGAINGYPTPLCRMLIEACTFKDDLIIDPFAGTGRLLGEAKRLGRRAIGYEIDNELIPVIEGNGVKVIQGKGKQKNAKDRRTKADR